MAQFWCDIYFWEVILNSNPYLERIIELGTWMGGFSWYLDMQTKMRGMKDFLTFDSIIHYQGKQPPGFEKVDIFANEKFVGDWIKLGPCALFCDNGNKPREIETFAPYLTNDSIVIVHDWMTEIFPSDIPDYLEELYGDFCDDIGSISRVFRKKAE